MCLAWGGDNLPLVGGACAGRPGWSPQQQLGGRGWRGAACPPLARPPPARTPGICRPSPTWRLQFLCAAGVRFSFCSAPRGEKANTVAWPPGAPQTFVPLVLLGARAAPGPRPPLLPGWGGARPAPPVPHWPFRQGQMVSIPGLGLPGPSGFTSDKWEFSGAVSPASPEDGAFRAPRASVLPGKSSSYSARPSLPPLTFIFQVLPFL